MKSKDDKRPVVRIMEGGQEVSPESGRSNSPDKIEKLKRTLILGLMGAVFVGCLFLIFKPSTDRTEMVPNGLNGAVPQATGAEMPDEKSKAYERESLDRKKQDKRKALFSLSEYWNMEEDGESIPERALTHDHNGEGADQRDRAPAYNSYRNAQGTLGSFYREEDYETERLREELEEFKERLAEKEVLVPDPVETQLALMEKSYQMAAKFLPVQPNTGGAGSDSGMDAKSITSDQGQAGQFVAFAPEKKKVVTALYREPSDSTFLVELNQYGNRGFHTLGPEQKVSRPKNAIKAYVLETKTVNEGDGVHIRLLEAARMPGHTVPKGTILMANAKFQGGRLQLRVSSLESDGTILPVDITIYDLDGQPGLHVPYSAEMGALTAIAGNMGQTAGTNLMMTNSAGQQVAADLSRGAVQGISGYFSKKVRVPKVTIKAGHRLYLVSKK